MRRRIRQSAPIASATRCGPSMTSEPSSIGRPARAARRTLSRSGFLALVSLAVMRGIGRRLGAKPHASYEASYVKRAVAALFGLLTLLFIGYLFHVTQEIERQSTL